MWSQPCQHNSCKLLELVEQHLCMYLQVVSANGKQVNKVSDMNKYLAELWDKNFTFLQRDRNSLWYFRTMKDTSLEIIF